MSIAVQEGRSKSTPIHVEKAWSLAQSTPESIAEHEKWVGEFRALCAKHDAEAAERKSKTTPIILNES